MKFVLFLVVAIGLIVPIVKTTLDSMVEPGGIIEQAGTPFEVAIWQNWWIIMLFIFIGYLVWWFGNKRAR